MNIGLFSFIRNHDLQCTAAASIIVGLAAATIIALALVHIFGATSTVGYIASLTAGSATLTLCIAVLITAAILYYRRKKHDASATVLKTDASFSEEIVSKDPSTDEDPSINMELFYAVEFKNLKKVKSLIQEGAKVDQYNAQGKAPLHIAETAEIVKVLIEEGKADIEIRDQHQNTPLHLAIRTGNLEVVESLLSLQANVNAENKFGHTPLHCANNRLIIEALLNHGALIEKGNNRGRTPLLEAADQAHYTALKVLKEHGADVNVQDNDGKMLNDFLQENLKILEKIDNVGTQIHAAVWIGDQDLIKQVAAASNNINVINKMGETALFTAVKYGYVDTIKTLIDLGINVNVKNPKGDTALFVAINSLGDPLDILAIVKALLESGDADVNSKGASGHTPLFRVLLQRSDIMVRAKSPEDLNIIKALIARGADFAADEKDSVPFMVKDIWSADPALYACIEQLANPKKNKVL